MKSDFAILTVPLNRYSWVLIICWTIVIAALGGWDLTRMQSDLRDLALHEARTAYERDILVRRWASDHGGVYVLVTKDTMPNPYLAHIPERDITTPSGRKLTLMNPAYITRQLHELQRKGMEMLGHITSLNPVRPQNAPDNWEVSALKAFEQGQTEVSSFEIIDGQEYLRLMRPLVTEKSCLKCHESQGYHEGDIRGGISVAVPMKQHVAASNALIMRLIIGYGLIWIAGVIMIGAGSHHLNHQILARAEVANELKRANEKLEKLAIEDGLTGLYNRRHLDNILDHELKRAYRKTAVLSFLMFDVDFFKRYNDHYGHSAGDKALQQIGKVLKGTFKRTSDLSARYGGEEFAVIIPDTPQEQVQRLAEILRQRIMQEAIPHEYSDAASVVTISIGVVSAVVVDLRDSDWFIRKADEALYQSKNQGRNCVTHLSYT